MTYRRPFRFLALALGLLSLAACGVGDGPLAPEAAAPPAGPQASLVGRGWRSNARLVTTSSFQSAHVSTAIIGAAGGVLRAGPHSLRVPAGAVPVPVFFSMAVVAGNHVMVDLGARSMLTGAQISVFPRPLTLTLDFSSATVQDPGRLKIVYVQNDRVAAEENTWVDSGGTRVTARIWHFSRYALAVD